MFAKLGDLAPVLVSFARTPIGSFGGALSGATAPFLGACAIRAAVASAGGARIEEAFFGNVLSAGIGQAPVTQAVKGAGLGDGVPATTINKVCASGMKAIMLGASSVALGQRNVVLAGGMESMSNVPHYLKARTGLRLGDATLVDGVVSDGLWDPYGNVHMGTCAEKIALEMGISRDEQDDYALESYRRAVAAEDAGVFAREITAVELPAARRGAAPTVVARDEEPRKVAPAEKVRALRPAFQKLGGTVTAANASSLNDGAAALVIMSRGQARALGLAPIASILGFADAQQAPADFTIAPALAVPLALQAAGLELRDVHLHEINEAFAVVALANARLLDLDLATVNVHGGAVSLGHPIGMSGARIVGSLANALKCLDKEIGVASICNGGGGASAIVIKRES